MRVGSWIPRVGIALVAGHLALFSGASLRAQEAPTPIVLTYRDGRESRVPDIGFQEPPGNTWLLLQPALSYTAGVDMPDGKVSARHFPHYLPQSEMSSITFIGTTTYGSRPESVIEDEGF
jgi:hypothetical protein